MFLNCAYNNITDSAKLNRVRFVEAEYFQNHQLISLRSPVAVELALKHFTFSRHPAKNEWRFCDLQCYCQLLICVYLHHSNRRESHRDKL